MKTRYLAGALVAAGAVALAVGVVVIEDRIEQQIRAALAQQVDRAYPGAVLKIDKLHYAVMSSRIKARGISIDGLMLPGPGGQPEKARLTITSLKARSPLFRLSAWLTSGGPAIAGDAMVTLIEQASAADIVVDRGAGGRHAIGMLGLDGLKVRPDRLAALRDIQGGDARQVAAQALKAVAIERITLEDMAVETRTTENQPVGLRVARMDESGIDGGRIVAVGIADFTLTTTLPDKGPAELSAGAIRMAQIDFSKVVDRLVAGTPTSEDLLTAFSQAMIGRVDAQSVVLTIAGQRAAAFDSLASQSSYSVDGIPLASSITLRGFDAGAAASWSESGRKVLGDLGLSRLTVDVDSAATQNRASGNFSLKSLEVDAREAGKLSLAMDLAGIDFEALQSGKTPDIGDLAKIRLRRLTFGYQDASFANRLLTYAARAGQQTPDALRASVRSRLLEARLTFAATPDLKAAFDALDTFVGDPRTLDIELQATDPKGMPVLQLAAPQGYATRPDGPLRLTVKANADR